MLPDYKKSFDKAGVIFENRIEGGAHYVDKNPWLLDSEEHREEYSNYLYNLVFENQEIKFCDMIDIEKSQCVDILADYSVLIAKVSHTQIKNLYQLNYTEATLKLDEQASMLCLINENSKDYKQNLIDDEDDRTLAYCLSNIEGNARYDACYYWRLHNHLVENENEIPFAKSIEPAKFIAIKNELF